MPPASSSRSAQTFGERLRALRLARMLTQAELAALLDVHHTQVSQWERGRNVPHPGRQRQIVEALGLTPQEFAATATTAAREGTADER